MVDARLDQDLPRGGTCPQCVVAMVELLKLLNWFTELLKVLVDQDAARGCNMYGWAVATLCLSSFLILQRLFDQVMLLTISTNIFKESRLLLGIISLPLTLAFLPFTYLSFNLYSVASDPLPSELTFFAQRNISMLLLGLPISNVVSTFLGDKQLVLHPMQVHLRAMQSVYQSVLEDIFCIVTDMLVITNAPADEGVSMFWLSFFFSVFNLLISCFLTVKEVNWSEQKRQIYVADQKAKAKAQAAQAQAAAAAVVPPSPAAKRSLP